ncbi:hypothetical protein Tsubulata_011995 [Turnera subulata]|uniref:AMP-dependent synthetase/ligase domain-containing protein n=1 Tax=Turnera subulata TaxID=218843 RepID=A0A9Q0J671_9ROSI|nr:hypothetical protein Tsubulata_011995 [Turnera subulata]
MLGFGSRAILRHGRDFSNTLSRDGPSESLKRRIVEMEKTRRRKNPKADELFVEVPESKAFLDTATMPMILTVVGTALVAKLLMMYDDSKSQEMIERKIKNAPPGQGMVRMLTLEEWEEIREVRPRTPFESKLARPNAKIRAGDLIRMGCFRQNITVVTIYASPGEDALIHSLNETQVSTLICDSKQLKKLASISSKLTTLRNVFYFEDNESATMSDSGISSNWKVSSFSKGEKLGKSSPVLPNFPSKNGIAVIMYTSGSVGQPKVAKAAKLDKFETPARIELLLDPWTPEFGLVTAALKIKSEQLKSNFKDELRKVLLVIILWVI